MLLEIDLAALGEQQDRGLADLGHVPGVVLGVDHRLDLGHRLGVGLHADDLDAGLLRERLVEALAVGLGVHAAVVAHDDALGSARARTSHHRRGQQGEAGGAGLNDAAAGRMDRGVSFMMALLVRVDVRRWWKRAAAAARG